MKDKIEKELEAIRPALRADGGDVEFLGYADGVVKVKLTGACAGCPMATITLKNHIEHMLKSRIPEVTAVESVD